MTRPGTPSLASCLTRLVGQGEKRQSIEVFGQEILGLMGIAARMSEQDALRANRMDVAEAFRRAVDFHRRGQLAEAERLYAAILEAQRDHFDALHLLGTVKQRRGDLSEALRLIGAALRVNPDSPEAHSNYGLVLDALGRHQEALASFDRALAIKPDFAEVLYNRGNTLQALDRHEEALKTFDAVLALRPGIAEAFNNRGISLGVLNRYDEALASFDQALAIRPQFPDALNNRGNALRSLNRHEEALANFERALALRPDYAEALNNRGNALQALDRYGEALVSFERALTVKPDFADAWNNRGNILQALDRHEEALASFDRAIAIKPDYAEAHHNRGTALAERRKFDEAQLEYEKALVLRPDYADALTSLGLLHLGQGRRDEAVAAAEAADRLSGKLSAPDSHYSLGVLLARCGLAEAARKHIQTYLERDPKDRKGGRMLLAGLGFGAIPERAPDTLIDSVYARRAASWDQRAAAGARSYRGDALVASMLERLAGQGAGLEILDAGCGTGLVGARIKHRAARLDGIDMSAAMLAQAEKKTLYDNLYRGDLVSLMAGRESRYDAIASAATLIHFGELRPAFEAAATALRDGGLFVFTLFAGEDAGSIAVHPVPGLAQGGCYVHGREYVARTAEAANFRVESIEDEIHEYLDDGTAVTGLVVALRRQAR